MKKARNQKITKQIICIITVLMLCNFIIPNNIYASTDLDDGGSIFDPCIKFATFLCDSLMQFLQETFTSSENIEVGDGTYRFQYGPGIIFSGKVQGLNINFISPNTDERNTNNFQAYFREKEEQYFNDIQNDGTTNVTEAQYISYYEEAKKHEGYLQMLFSHSIPTFGAARSCNASIIYYEEMRGDKTYLCVEYFVETEWFQSGADMQMKNSYTYNYKTYEVELNEQTLKDMNAVTTYTSIAYELQPTIATWYNALRRIALVGLLSVLVYVGIRMVLSSTGDKSKYKKMLTDWLIAICLLFTLHYIMSATLVITRKTF